MKSAEYQSKFETIQNENQHLKKVIDEYECNVKNSDPIEKQTIVEKLKSFEAKVHLNLRQNWIFKIFS